MADLLKVSKELITITEYLRDEYGIYYADGNLYDFDQLWGSTALGFEGIGGSMMTWARTYVFIPKRIDKAYVFFGDKFAYVTPMNDRFWEDVKNQNMASVAKMGRYST